MTQRGFRNFNAATISLVSAVVLSALAVPVSAQPTGVPEDWSHQHLIYSNPETQDEAIQNGTLDEWTKKADDPRFVLALEKKEKKGKDGAGGKRTAVNEQADTVAHGSITTKAVAFNAKKQPKPTPGPEIHRDWSNVMGGGSGTAATGSGDTRNFPAKFRFFPTGKDCATDFVVFTTSAAGATSTGNRYQTTGTFSAAATAGETFTITNTLYIPDQVLTLTADASVNTGLKFAVGANATDSATNLANAIARNGGTVGMTATSAGAVVTVNSVTANVQASAITPSETSATFAWGAESNGSTAPGQPTIFALNQLYADTVANTGCQTATQAVPATYWSYYTGTPAATYSGTTGTAASISTTAVYGPLSASTTGTCTSFVATTNPGNCDTAVSVATPISNLVITLDQNIPGSTTYRFTVYKNGLATALTCDITSLKTCSDTTHSETFTAGDKVAVQVVMVSGTASNKKAAPFTVTAPAAPFIASLSPVLSFYDNGQQVAFVQTANNVASLVLLKWSASSPGTVGAPTTPTLVAPASYRGCTAPCMTILPFAGSTNDTNSAPFIDYGNDFAYVGDDDGNVHKFSGVFSGTPAEAGSPWPVSVGTDSILSSPVFDGTNIYVGSNGPNATGNRLHSINFAGTTVIASGAIGSSSSVNGVRDAPIVDASAQRVYAFIGSDNAAADSLGNSCLGGHTCAAVYQFVTNSSLATQNAGLGAGLGAKVIVGASDNQGDLNRAINSGAFDDAYYSTGSGNLYVCGSQPATARLFTLWKVTLTGNSFSARTQGPQINNANGVDVCSPVTTFKNGSNEFLYVSVANGGSAAGGGGCTTPATGCVYAYTLAAPSSGTVFNTTSTSSTTNNANRFISVSTSTALNATEATVATALTAATAGSYSGMTITQSTATPAATTHTYTLRNTATSTAITCTIPALATTCSDTTHTAGYAVGDTIDVLMVKVGTNSTGTFQVQLTADVTWNSGKSATAALNATGGTGGIVIDNTATGGGSQVYFSTRGAGATPAGIAVQASQAALN